MTVSLPLRRGGFEDPSTVRDLAQAAEEAGFWGLTAPDHIVAPNAWAQAGGGERWPDPFVLLGYLAGVTRRVRLIAHVVVLPYRHPLAVAKALASVDHLSGGRAILGVGSGYLREEFEALGVPFEERGARTDEGLRLVQAAWTEGDITFEGTFWSVADARMEPQPVQRPRPPIWIGGNSLRAVRRAVELGDCWAPFDVTDDQLRAGIARAERLGRRVEVAAPVGRVSKEPGGRGVGGDEAVARVRALEDLGVGVVKCAFAGQTADEWLANLTWFAEAAGASPAEA